MNNSDCIVFNTLNKIRSSAIFTERSFLDDFYIARTGTYCRMPGISQPLFVGGFSCKQDSVNAESVACFEVAERALATYYLSDPILRDEDYPLFSIHSGRNIGFVKSEKVLLGTALNGQKNDTDAVGLGFHIEKVKAIDHAIFELLERHILGKIWYEEQPLIQISEDALGQSGYIINDFTIKSDKALPFVMSVLLDDECNLLCVGASFTCSILESRKKARSEAIMLAHDVISNKTVTNISNKSSQKRMLSQNDQHISLRRKNYILSLIVDSINIDFEKELSLMQSLEILHLGENDINYCLLHETHYGYLARAVSDKLLTLREYRKQYAHTEKYIIDPIC